MNHQWVGKSGQPWTPRVKSDLCARCGKTPDAHTQTRVSDTAGWEDFVPQSPLEALGVALITAGFGDPDEKLRVAMDRAGAERIIEALRHYGYRIVEAER